MKRKKKTMKIIKPGNIKNKWLLDCLHCNAVLEIEITDLFYKKSKLIDDNNVAFCCPECEQINCPCVMLSSYQHEQIQSNTKSKEYDELEYTRK